MVSPTPDLRDAEHTMRDAEHTMRDVEHTIATRVVEHVKARRIGVNALEFTLELLAKNAQLAEREAKLGVLATDNQRLVLELERLERLERLANATGTHFMWAFNDMLWV